MKIISFLFLILLSLSLLIGCSNHAYRKAKERNTFFAYDLYLSKYPNSKHVEEVKDLREKALFQSCNNNNYNNKTKFEKAIKCFQLYLDQYPKGRFVSESKSKIEKFWYNKLMLENTIFSLNKYLKMYPNGMYLQNVNKRIEELNNRYNSIKRNMSPSIYEDVYKAADMVDICYHKFSQEMKKLTKKKYESTAEFNQRLEDNKKKYQQMNRHYLNIISFLTDKSYTINSLPVEYKYNADNEFIFNLKIILNNSKKPKCYSTKRDFFGCTNCKICCFRLIPEASKRYMKINFLDKLVGVSIITAQDAKNPFTHELYKEYNLLIYDNLKIDRKRASQLEGKLKALVKFDLVRLSDGFCPEPKISLKSIKLYSEEL